MDKVYWIRNQECTDIKTHGYVGVSQDPAKRFKSHLKNNQRIPKTGIWLEIVFEGTRDECFAKEEELRPIKNTGWNRAVGGVHGYKKGFAHSDETRAHLKSKWTEERRKKAGQFRREQNKKLIGQKRPKQSQAMAGKNNPMFGQTHGVEAIQKIIKAGLGRTPPNKQEMFCIFCHKQTPLSILIKYHGLGKKNCINGKQ